MFRIRWNSEEASGSKARSRVAKLTMESGTHISPQPMPCRMLGQTSGQNPTFRSYWLIIQPLMPILTVPSTRPTRGSKRPIRAAA